MVRFCYFLHGFHDRDGVNPDEPSAGAPCDDLSNFAVESPWLARAHPKHQRGMKLRILS
jgi:hypothetical protein